MRRKSLAILFLIWSVALHAQLTLRVTALPDNTPAEADIHVAGNFNGWDPGNTGYLLSPTQDGEYEITFSPAPGDLAYKFTRGSWPTVEGNADGGFRPNRTLTYDGTATTVELEILSWEDLGGGGGSSTAADNVSILSQDFYIPQLDRQRRIWIYLPPDYEASDHTYPVLYMHDGQNVFDAATSFAGEWEVDESLNQLFADGDEGIIVVAIDNGGVHRIDEYSPWIHPTYGGGEGNAYIDFIAQTLKPHIDANYRTRPGREHTGIMGSSMGGLISLYGAIEHQDVFGKAGIFSPSLWFSDEAYTHVSTTGRQAPMRFYLLAGENEGADVVSDLITLYDTLLDAGFPAEELTLLTHPDGEHSEWYWAREFPDAYLWLFGDELNAVRSPESNVAIRLYPNPVDDILYLEASAELDEPSLRIFSEDGKEHLPFTPMKGNALNIGFLPPGVYLVLIYEDQQIIGVQKLVKIN